MALAALLSALSLLIFSAQRITGKLQQSSQESSERYSLSYEAFFIDTAADSLSSAEFEQRLRGNPSSDGGWIVSKTNPTVREIVFHKISADKEGRAYVQKGQPEPV